MAAGHVAHQAAGLGDQQRARRHVPFLQAQLEEAVQAAGGHPGQVQRRGAGPAQAGGGFRHRPEHAHVGVHVGHLVVAERETGADQSAVQAGPVGDAQAAAVEGRATAPTGGEFFLAQRIVDHRVLHLAFDFQGDGYRVLRQAVDKVGGAVERIDHPQVIGAGAGARLLAAFLGENAVLGVGFADGVDDACFRGPVHLGDEVVGRLPVHGQGVVVLRRAADQVAGLAGGSQGNVHLRRVHAIILSGSKSAITRCGGAGGRFGRRIVTEPEGGGQIRIC